MQIIKQLEHIMRIISHNFSISNITHCHSTAGKGGSAEYQQDKTRQDKTRQDTDDNALKYNDNMHNIITIHHNYLIIPNIVSTFRTT